MNRQLIIPATLTLMLLGLFVGAVQHQLSKLPNIAERLPAETQAFSVFREDGEVQTSIWLNDERLTLEEVPQNSSTLAEDPNYQNVRNRLSHQADAFLYFSSEFQKPIIAWLTREGFASVGAWAQIFQRIPAAGLTLDLHEQGWYGESFIAIDKSQLSQDLFYDPQQGYRGELLPFAPNDADLVLGGVDLHDQLTVLSTHLADFSPDLAQEWRAQLSALDQVPSNFLREEYLLARNESGWLMLFGDASEQHLHVGELGEGLTPPQKILSGSDIYFRFQVENVDNVSIMMSSGIKLFDDGIASRHIIEETSSAHGLEFTHW